jgi:hypothetical protein
MFRLKPNKHRMKPDPESGQAVLIRKIRALNLADILHLGKLSMVLFCALNPMTRLEQFQLGGTLLEKSQNNFLLATQDSCLEELTRRRIIQSHRTRNDPKTPLPPSFDVTDSLLMG